MKIQCRKQSINQK